MAHFGYTSTKGIVGEVASTAPRITRSFTASERINFGQLVKMDRTKPAGSNNVNLVLDGEEDYILGVAAYQPTHPKGYYEAGDNVSVITKGDVFVKVEAGSLFNAGNLVYISYLAQGEGNSDYIFSPYVVPNITTSLAFYYGTFVEGGVGSADKYFAIHFNNNHQKIIAG